MFEVIPLTEQDRDRLRQGLDRLGVAYTQEAEDKLALYCHRLLEKNQVMNLTAITDPAEVVKLHFLDSAALLPTKALGGRKIIDVGTGAGFPGLVLKLLDPTIRLTLLTAWASGLPGSPSCARSWPCPTWSSSRAGRRSSPTGRPTGRPTTWPSPGPWLPCLCSRSSACLT